MKICLVCGEVFSANFNIKCHKCGSNDLRKITSINIGIKGKFDGTYEYDKL